jgi:hypothetical protein
MNNQDYYRAVLLGIVIGVTFLSFFYTFTTNDEPKSQPVTPKSNFEIVDTYKGCEIIRWTGTHNLATYKYFLHCEK